MPSFQHKHADLALSKGNQPIFLKSKKIIIINIKTYEVKLWNTLLWCDDVMWYDWFRLQFFHNSHMWCVTTFAKTSHPYFIHYIHICMYMTNFERAVECPGEGLMEASNGQLIYWSITLRRRLGQDPTASI